MKRCPKLTALLLLLALLCALFTGCAKQDAADAADGPAQTEEAAEAEVPFSAKEAVGRPQEELRKALEDSGFTNVRAEGSESDGEDGIVTAVSVDGATEFDTDAKFPADTPVVVHYCIAVEQEAVPQTDEPQPSASEAAQPSDYGTAPAQTETPSPSGGSGTGSEAPSQPAQETPAETPSGSGVLVWIPTHGGTKYHSNSGCSNMIDPEQVTLDQAQSMGFTACKRCY